MPSTDRAAGVPAGDPSATAIGEAGLDALADRLGHRFRRPELLAEALTHSSAVQPRREPTRRKRRGKREKADNPDKAASYERLEFLGDRVLGLIVAETLLAEFPDEAEGEIARRHAQLVSREILAEVARGIDLGDFIRLEMGEEADQARDNDTLLSDVCEGVIAALYLDGGLAAARQFVEPRWRALARAERKPPQDNKTRLQEWAQGEGRPLPVYRERGRKGPPHAPSFTVSVEVEGESPAEGRGRSKRQAEQAAAEAMLRRLGILP